MENVLHTNKLTKRFGKFVAVRELDLDVTRGEIYGFLGPNGAGKSTTIRILLDLIRPSSGSAEIFGRDVRKHGTSIRRRVGYLPGELALYENLSPRQLYAYSGALYGVRDLDYALELSERLQITDVDRKIGALSQGNKQKVGVVQALLHRPELAILDEPTNALDPLVRQEVYKILEEARSRGMTIFFSSHVLAEAERVCDRVAIIRDGELTRVGTVEELKAVSPRRLRLRFDGPAPLDELRAVDGVSDLHAGPDGSVALMVRERVDQIVQIAARHDARDFYSEDVSLEDIFLGYYGATDGHAPGGPNGNGRRANGVNDRRPAPAAIERQEAAPTDDGANETHERIVEERPAVRVPADHAIGDETGGRK